MSTRRKSLGSMSGLLATCHSAEAGGRPAHSVHMPALNTLPKPLVNHVGYRSGDAKHVVVAGAGTGDTFEIYRMRKKGMAPCFTGKLMASGQDFGSYRIGDFSLVREPGYYRVAVPATSLAGEVVWACSQDFQVDDHVWDGVLGKLVDYYRMQSCGASAHGYNSPCHTGPIRRLDGGVTQPITGGWHSAHDHVRDLSDTLHGAFGLLAVARGQPNLASKLGLFEEVCWGNDYFLKVQDLRGFACAGVYTADYFEPKDWWDSSSYVLLTEPAALYCQHQFMAVQALIATSFGDKHPEYARQCLSAARRCFEYCRDYAIGDWEKERLSYGLGTGAFAGALMFQATGEQEYFEYARTMANELTALQDPTGFWPERPGTEIPAVTPEFNLANARYLYGAYAPLGLCAAARLLPRAPERTRWIAALERFASSYVKYFTAANAFGILPVRITSTPQSGGRHWKGFCYRYFTDPSQKIVLPGTRAIPWRTGNTATIAGHGVVLLELARLLGDASLHALAQRQLDWVMGSNPFDSSLVLGVGHNQPATYPCREFFPTVPDIEGAVLQGPIGDDADQPILIPGYWPSCEYYLPHHSWALWLMAELSAGR